jgi:XTP/dITP diphosphohydrolase
MREFILASSNEHKVQEFLQLFQDQILIKPSAKTLSVEENGVHYHDNALIKAKAYYEEFNLASLADDSGLTIEALPDMLGVHSARFLPEKKDYKDKCLAILDLLKNHENRKAYFSCVLCFYINPTEIYFFEGKVHGEIGHSYQGNQGFGYDPIFIPHRSENDGKTLAELAPWKNQHSHRAKACQAALSFFRQAM